jgi:hypothetical protein
MIFFTYQLELEELLKRKVDLVSSQGLSRHIKPFVDRDKILIYEGGMTDSVRVAHVLDAIREVRETILKQTHSCRKLFFPTCQSAGVTWF